MYNWGGTRKLHPFFRDGQPFDVNALAIGGTLPVILPDTGEHVMLTQGEEDGSVTVTPFEPPVDGITNGPHWNAFLANA